AVRSDVCAGCGVFFPAEDGIRDFHVTGVQTCALPIYREVLVEPQDDARALPRAQAGEGVPHGQPVADGGLRARDDLLAAREVPRSEERRVGKVRRWRRGTSYSRKNRLSRRSEQSATH